MVQNALVAAAILAEFVVIIGHPLFGWGATTYAATPRPLVLTAPLPPSGRAVLLTLSATAARQPVQLLTPGQRYAYVRRQGWKLARRERGESPPAHVVTTVTESWTAAGGAGRSVTTATGPKGATVADTAVAGGHPLPALAANEAALARTLGLGYPGPVPSARQFVAFTDVADRQPIAGPVEAVMLKLLALTPGAINSGTVTDRGGRRGVAVSVESGYTGAEILYTLIFDPTTGQLLESDQTLSGDPGDLDVPQGSVLAYTTFLTSGHVAGTTTGPAG